MENTKIQQNKAYTLEWKTHAVKCSLTREVETERRHNVFLRRSEELSMDVADQEMPVKEVVELGQGWRDFDPFTPMSYS